MTTEQPSPERKPDAAGADASRPQIEVAPAATPTEPALTVFDARVKVIRSKKASAMPITVWVPESFRLQDGTTIQIGLPVKTTEVRLA